MHVVVTRQVYSIARKIEKFALRFCWKKYIRRIIPLTKYESGDDNKQWCEISDYTSYKVK